MTSDQIPDEYRTDSDELIEIGEDALGFYVRCWTDDQLHWEVRGVVIEATATRETRRPYTREEALAEFNRWR